MGESRKKAGYGKDGIDCIAAARQLDADYGNDGDELDADYGNDGDELDVNRPGLSAHSRNLQVLARFKKKYG